MAPARNVVASEDEIDDLRVTLRPVLGIAPRVYITVLWGAAAAAVLFFTLVFPGIVRYGAIARFESAPSGAEVYVDESRVGATPITAFVPAGDREIVIRHGGGEWRAGRTIPGRRVGSLIAPRRARVVARITETAEDVLPVAAADLASWAAVGRPSAQFQQPPIGHTVARLVWAEGNADTRRDARRRLLVNLVSHAAPWQYADVGAAAVRVGAAGAMVGPVGIGQLVSDFVRLDNEYPELFAALGRVTSEYAVAAAALGDSRWYTERAEASATRILAASVALDEDRSPSPLQATVGGHRFVRVPAGTYIPGYPLRNDLIPGSVVTYPEPFFVLSAEVTNAQFAAFADQREAWAPEAASRLVEAGLVDEYYLESWPSDWRSWIGDPAERSGARLPVTHVSWYAADAYARWVGESVRAVPEWSGYQVRLPTAVEFEYAAFLDGLGDADAGLTGEAPRPTGAGRPGALGARGLVGNVWEWTDSWHAINARQVEPEWGDQRIVAGGAFVSQAVVDAGIQTDLPDHATRGAQPPDWATPYLGFRIVLVPVDRDGD